MIYLTFMLAFDSIRITALIIVTTIFISGISLSFAEESKIVIPYEFKSIAGMWYEGKITNHEFLQATQIRINLGTIIILNTDTQGTDSTTFEIPSWIKNNAGWWANGQIDDKEFAQGIQYLFKSGILPVTVDSKLDPVLLPPSYDYKHQDTDDEIRFSGFRGELINCETFSYVVPISVSSKSSVPVVIEIIDPDGNIAGRDNFQSDNYESHRIIEMNWGRDGKYLIQVHYKGDVYQEDFSYDKQTPEVYDGYRTGCLKKQYIESVRDLTFTWFNFLSLPTQEGFDKNVKIAEELVRDSNSTRWMDFVSEKNINNPNIGEKQLHDLQASFSQKAELKSILSDRIERKVMSVFQESENKLIDNQSISLDQKADLIFELRAERDRQVINQKAYAEEYVENLYRLYSKIKASQDYMKQYNKLVDQINLQEKEKELQIIKEKEAIKQEVLSQERTISPTTIIEPTCNDSLILIYKTSDNSTACVKSTTAEKLIQRGWGHSIE